MHPRPDVGALTLCGAIAVGELFFLYERWSAAREADTKLVQRQTDIATMTGMLPPPTREAMLRAQIFGFTAVAIGAALAIGIFVALLGSFAH